MERTRALMRLDEEEQRWNAERAHRGTEQAGLEIEAAEGSTVQAGDRSDISTATRAWEEDAEYLRLADAALAEIAAARQRLADGTYGRCLTCQAGINPERLEVLPATQFCIHHVP